MTPTKQTKLYQKDGAHNGNCFAACVASLLDLPLWMVPPFEEGFGRAEWYETRFDEWLARMFKMRRVKLEGHQIDKLPEFYVASGHSERGVSHAVIYSNGIMVHDPHPSNGGIMQVDYVWFVENLEM